MKALTIKQPWASAVVAGLKDIENRTWPTTYRGSLLVHASVRDDPAGWGRLESDLPLPTDPPRGGIVGIVELVDCVRNHHSPWALPGHWHWVLRDPRPLPFAPCRGRLGLWEYRPTIGQAGLAVNASAVVRSIAAPA